MDSPMSRYAGNAETRTLFQQRAFGELNDLCQRNRGELSRSSERSIGLSAITPDTPTNPFTRHSLTDRINGARTIAVRNDTRVWHPDAERILAFLDIARIDPRESTLLSSSRAFVSHSASLLTSSTAYARSIPSRLRWQHLGTPR